MSAQIKNMYDYDGKGLETHPLMVTPGKTVGRWVRDDLHVLLCTLSLGIFYKNVLMSIK